MKNKSIHQEDTVILQICAPNIRAQYMKQTWTELKGEIESTRGDGGAWWAAVYGIAQSRTRLKRLGSSNSKEKPKIIWIHW